MAESNTYCVVCRDHSWYAAPNVVKIYEWDDDHFEWNDITEEIVKFLEHNTGLDPYMLSDGSGWAMIPSGESFSPADFAESLGGVTLFTTGQEPPKLDFIEFRVNYL